MNKIKISMIRYDGNGNPVDVAYGEYKPEDVAMFRRDGFQDVSEELARNADSELVQKLKEIPRQ
jgi:hypothetical protein